MSLPPESADALAPLGHCRALITVVVTVVLAIVVNLAPTAAVRCLGKQVLVSTKIIFPPAAKIEPFHMFHPVPFFQKTFGGPTTETAPCVGIASRVSLPAYL